MDIVHEVAAAAGHAIQGIRAGSEKLASHKLAEGVTPTIEVRSIAFEPGSALPISCTVDGVGAPPALSFAGIPSGAQSLVVLCEDPDAPLLEPFVHWLAYDLPADATSIDAQTQHDFRLGENSRSEPGFTPAAPPPGHGVHHYHFQVFALDVEIVLSTGRDRDDILAAAKGHVLAWGEIVGTYERE
jgi:Raf kinase inhibitor-like YbhB/YbcL family protein